MAAFIVFIDNTIAVDIAIFDVARAYLSESALIGAGIDLSLLANSPRRYIRVRC